MSANGISPRGVNVLCDALAFNRSITKLDLSCTVSFFFPSLSLSLSHLLVCLFPSTVNNFGSQVGRKLGDFLKSNQTLQRLNLRGEKRMKVFLF